jgi:hypothetical protein
MGKKVGYGHEMRKNMRFEVEKVLVLESLLVKKEFCMRIRQFAIIFLLIIDCVSDTHAQKNNDIFTGDDKNGSLTIYNLASFDVVIFAGRVTRNIVLGGIKTGKNRTFDLTKLPLPEKNGSFLIRAVLFETYIIKNSQVSEEDVLYTGLVTYDLNNPNDKTDPVIYDGLDQSKRYRIIVSNDSKFVLELRYDNPSGMVLSTLTPYERNKNVFLIPLPDGRPYQIYPLYIYVDPNTNERTSFIAKSRLEQIRVNPNTDAMNVVVFTGPKDTSDIDYNVCFLRIRNYTNEGLMLRNGMTRLKDQKGNFLVRPGSDKTFEMDAMDAGRIYQNLNIEFESTMTLDIKSIFFRRGVVYELTVITRNGNAVYDIRETGFKEKLNDLRINLLLE